MSASLNRIFAPLPSTERGKSVQLGRDPKLKNFLYAAGSGVVIRDIEVRKRRGEEKKHTTHTLVMGALECDLIDAHGCIDVF